MRVDLLRSRNSSHIKRGKSSHTILAGGNGAKSHAEFVQRSVERSIELLLKGVARVERSRKAFSLIIAEFSASDSFPNH